MADFLDSVIDRRLIDALLVRLTPGLGCFTLPLGFRLLDEQVFQFQSIRLRQLSDAVENLDNRLAHGTTSRCG
jgi:hypothetical protein